MNGVEYSFWPKDSGSFLQRQANSISSPGTVRRGSYAGIYRKTLTRTVPGDAQRVQNILNQAIKRWNGTEYAVFKNRNCNHFTDHVLQALGSQGLDSEYLRHSGLRPGLGAAQQFVQDAGTAGKKAGGDIAREGKKAGGKISNATKSIGGKASDLFKGKRPW